MGDTGNLEKLREITPHLNSLTGIGGTYIEYDLLCGSSIGFGLYKTNSVAVQRNCLSSGSVFPLHQHSESEVLIIYIGEVKVSVNDEEIILGVGDSICFPPGAIHKVEALDDTWLLGITIPADESYPDV